MNAVRNDELAAMLGRVAELLEVKGDTRFRIQAYQRAAQALENLPRPAAELLAEGGKNALQAIPGIGEGIAAKVEELVSTNRLKYLDELIAQLPPGLPELLQVPHLGPKTAMLVAEQLKVRDVESLEKAAKAHKLAALPRLGKKAEENILKGIAIWKQGQERMPLGQALPLAEEIAGKLSGVRGIKSVTSAGSVRRMRETVGDLDFLAVTTGQAGATAAMKAFTTLPGVVAVTSRGDVKAQVRLKSLDRALDADLRLVEAESFGAALHYFTGSKTHNIQVRELGVKKGLKISEYGVFRGEKRIGGITETEVFSAVGLPFIPPELREGAGEVEAALAGKLPQELREKDLKGDLHVHSEWSDGEDSLEDLAKAGREAGYEYIAVADHSRSVKIANGLSIERLRARNKAIDKLNASLSGFRLLKASEVDILEDGSLDFPDEVLSELDVVVASVHTRFNLPPERQTARIVRAVSHPLVNVLGHPTGRLLAEREALEFDMPAVLAAAARHGTAMELNSHPTRLDLNDAHLKLARQAGAKVSIDSDSHHGGGLALHRRYGVAMARRGWLEPRHILNTLALAPLLKALKGAK